MKRPAKRAPTRLVPTAARSQPRAPVEFVPTGCYLLDRIFGGGWAIGRVANLVGDRSSGKTMIAVEACNNFLPYVNHPDDIRYVEAESAYDPEYGRQLGMADSINPVDHITTVEQLFEDLSQFVNRRINSHTPSLYVVDSLDALSDTAEMERGIEEGSYGTSKARKLSELFRREVTNLSMAKCTLLVVSQIRDKIGVKFGETKTRSGGRALDFYASNITWLSEIGKLRRTISGESRAIGVHVKAQNRKLKVGLPFRQADITLLFEYGVDDETSMIDFLSKQKPNGVDINDLQKQLASARRGQDREWVQAINELLRELVGNYWDSIDTQLRPTMAKYPQ